MRGLQLGALDQPGQQRHRRGHVDHGGAAVGEDDHQERAQRQRVEPPQQRDDQQQPGLDEVGADHQRKPSPPVDDGAHDQAEHEVGQPPRRVQPADVRAVPSRVRITRACSAKRVTYVPNVDTASARQ